MPQIDDQLSQILNGFLLVVCLLIPALAIYYLVRLLLHSSTRHRKRKIGRELRRLFLKEAFLKTNQNHSFEPPKLTPLSSPGRARPTVIEGNAADRNDKKPIDAPVFRGSVGAYGYGLESEPFHEEALILNANANGGILQLSVPVREGENLLLTNDDTFETQICRIVHVSARDEHTILAAIEFASPCPEFWSNPNKAEGSPPPVRPANTPTGNARGDWNRDVKHRASGGSS